MTGAPPVGLDSTPKQIVLEIVRHLPDEVTRGTREAMAVG